MRRGRSWKRSVVHLFFCVTVVCVCASGSAAQDNLSDAPMHRFETIKKNGIVVKTIVWFTVHSPRNN